MALHNWFLPHKETHKKAHLISWEALLFYILIFILLQVGFSLINFAKPGLLGISANIDQKKIIELTNKEREKLGLTDVRENEALDKAAALKAQNMFSENYWAHFSPSGKTPWDFILGSGYKFTFAGENLAKNFYSSNEVVNAWMASPTHRDNLLNNKYQDIGVAVVDGILNGQKTTLIVQEFGTTQVIANNNPAVSAGGKDINVPKNEYNNEPQLVAAAQTPKLAKPVIDPYQLYKTMGVSLVTIIGVLLLIDMLVLIRRGVFRLSSHNLAHMVLLSVTTASLITGSPGAVL